MNYNNVNNNPLALLVVDNDNTLDIRVSTTFSGYVVRITTNTSRNTYMYETFDDVLEKIRAHLKGTVIEPILH